MRRLSLYIVLGAGAIVYAEAYWGRRYAFVTAAIVVLTCLNEVVELRRDRR